MEERFLKITNAAYKVLDFFPDSDPLKNKAKEKVLAVLENLTLVFDAKGWVSLQKEKASAQLLDDIGILENYFTLGRYQGFIDNVNFLIITREYEKIKSEIARPKGFIRQNLEVISNIPETPAELVETITTPVAVAKPKENTYTDRQRKIMEVLAGKEKAQVSDFIKELPSVTKRTLRRDLNDLLKKGKVVRVGEWNQVFYQMSKDNNKSS